MSKFSLKAIILFFTAVMIPAGYLSAVEEPQEQAASDSLDRPNIEYTAEQFKDPFQSVFVDKWSGEEGEQKQESAQPPSLTINGIVWGGNVPQAVINNSIVRAGDVVGETKIIKIDKDGVVVSVNGRQYFFPSPAKVELRNMQDKTEGGQNE